VVDKNQAIINFLLQCPTVAANPVFFNFINGKDDDKQIVTQSTDKALNRAYIDGSVSKRFTFTLLDFRSVSYEPLPRIAGKTSENVEEMFDVQGIVDWIEEQADLRNYPNFGDTCQIDSMQTTSDTPSLNGVDTSVTPALAKYSITIQIDYIDLSKSVWQSN